MLLFIFMLFISKIVWCNHVGSTLFYKRLSRADCWSKEDIARLRVRKIFEDSIIPPVTSPDKINDDYIKSVLRFFRNALKSAEINSGMETMTVIQEVLSDTIGAHMRSEILPTVRFAYYSGYVPYKRVRELHDFYNDVKKFLNTQGLGWKKPSSVPELTNITVEKIRIGSGKYLNSCSSLVTKRDTKSCIHFPPLKTDEGMRPSVVMLPFKSGGLVNLVSPSSRNVLLKYYTTASRCILDNSPESCRHSDFVNFNNDLWHWMKREVAPHLNDEKLYSAYGGVLRIAAATQKYGRELPRRNIFDIQESRLAKWHPWKILTSYANDQHDWTPLLYVAVVIMVIVGICMLQICYSYVVNGNNCCKTEPKYTWKENEVSYAKVDSSIPAMLPSHQSHQSAAYCSEQKRQKKQSSKTKTSSIGSIRTQKVYDMHENTEKLMAVIMSDSEKLTDDSFPISKSSANSSKKALNVCRTERPKSPPKIETPVTQIQRKAVKTNVLMPKFSSTTVNNSMMTYQRGQETETWSESASSTSAQSFTSTGSKSRTRKSISKRDLAWARRVVSKHSLHAKSSGTELDLNSYTTPISTR